MLDMSKKGYRACWILMCAAFIMNAGLILFRPANFSAFDLWYWVILCALSGISLFLCFLIKSEGLWVRLYFFVFFVTLIYFMPPFFRFGGSFLRIRSDSKWIAECWLIVVPSVLYLIAGIYYFHSGRFSGISRFILVMLCSIIMIVSALSYLALLLVLYNPDGKEVWTPFTELVRKLPDRESGLFLIGLIVPLTLRALAVCILLMTLPARFDRIKGKTISEYEHYLISNYRKSEYAKATGLKRRNVYHRYMDMDSSGHFGEYEAYCVLNETLPGKKRFLFNVVIPEDEDSFTEVDLLCFWRGVVFVIEAKRYSGLTIYADPDCRAFDVYRGEEFVRNVENIFWQNWIHLLAVFTFVDKNEGFSQDVTIIPLTFLSIRTGFKYGEAENFRDIDYMGIPRVLVRADSMYPLVKNLATRPEKKEAEQAAGKMYEILNELPKYSQTEYRNLVDARKESGHTRHRSFRYVIGNPGNHLMRTRDLNGHALYLERLTKDAEGNTVWSPVPFYSIFEKIQNMDLQTITKEQAVKRYREKKRER